ncbi:MAG: tetratricopeptide repeat protein [Nitrospirae bacterium]|nr:tetratricopeptide repeat protein [Nitrospirota bacterium]
MRFEAEWGNPGGRNGPFRGPAALALDSASNLYVADSKGDRILLVGADGRVIRSLGSRGEGAGQFDSPSGIGVDREGRIYVSDTGNDRIQVLAPSGTPVYVFGAEGNGPKQFDEPRGLALISDLLFVADAGNHRIQVFSRDGVFLHAFGNEQTLQKPVDVAAGSDGRVFVADESGNRMQVFNLDGALKRTMSAPTDVPENLLRPVSVDVDARGYLFVADSGNFKMKKFDPSYKVVASMGSKAKTGSGAFIEMSGLAADSAGRVYVSDAEKNTIQIFSTERESQLPLPRRILPFSAEVEEIVPGRVLDRVRMEDGSTVVLEADSRKMVVSGVDGTRIEMGPFREPVSLGVDRSSSPLRSGDGEKKRYPEETPGNIWVVDAGAHQILKYAKDGTRLLAIGKKGSAGGYLDSPRGMAFSTNGNLYVADTGNHRIQIFTPEGLVVGSIGRKGEAPGMLREPVSIAMDDSNNVYVAEEANARVSRFDEQGKLIGIIGGRGTASGRFEKPRALAWSPSGSLLVYDYARQDIQLFTSEGEFISSLGSGGGGRGEFQSVESLRAPSPTQLWVMDGERGDTQVFTLRFTPQTPARVSAKGGLKVIELSWEAGGESYLDGFNLYRRENPRRAFERIHSTRESAWADREVVKDRTYEYAVSAVARDGFESPLSKSASAMPLKLVPQAPSGIKLMPRELAMVVSWQPNPEKFIDHYTVYRGETPIGDYKEVARQSTTVAFDRNLQEDRVYYYRVTATAKEGEESPAGTVVFERPLRSPVSKPPLQLAPIELRPLFASQYKLYEKESFGRVTIRNNTDLPIPNVRLSLSVKDYTDFPTQIAIQEIPPMGSEDRDVKLVFNNKILDLTESATVQLAFTLGYFEGRMERTMADAYPVTVYEKHVLTWDDPSKIAAFVTPGDPVVASVARAAIAEIPENVHGMTDNVMKAKTIFEVAGLAGVRYVADPNTPYKEASQNKARIDFVQFPRETIQLRAGDCDDLSSLFASLFENVGVTTVLLDAPPRFVASSQSRDGHALLAPGHIFIMFDSGLTAEEAIDRGFALDDFVACDPSPPTSAASCPIPVAAGFTPASEDAPVKGAPTKPECKDASIERAATSLTTHDPRLTTHDSSLCVPLEITMIGSSFREAWNRGITEWNEGSKEGQIRAIDIHQAWDRYKPPSLVPVDFKPMKIPAVRIEKEFPGELRSIALSHVQRTGAVWSEKLASSPDDPEALNRLAVLHAEFGFGAEAEKWLLQILARDAASADASNNLANIRFMGKDFKAAAELYARAATADPSDASILAGLARAQFRGGDAKQAKETLVKALQIDAGILDEYPDLTQIQR